MLRKYQKKLQSDEYLSRLERAGTYWVSKALCHRLTIRHILADGSVIVHAELECKMQK
jgi:hypothetical protein